MRGGIESRVKRLEIKYSGSLPMVILSWGGEPECLAKGCPDYDKNVNAANTTNMVFVHCDNSCKAKKGARSDENRRKKN